MQVSVIIPVYNAEQWLQRSISSVSSHDRVRQIILIDDGSTDQSLAIMRRAAEQDARILILQHPDKGNHGRSASRNLAIQHVTSEWVAFLDADDYYLENRFELPDVDADGYYGIIQSNYTDASLQDSMSDHTGITDKIKPDELYTYLTEQGSAYFSLISLTIKKEVILSLGGFDESLSVGEDTDLIWRLAHQYRLSPMNISAPIAIRTVHSQNSYSQKNNNRYLFYRKWCHQKEYPLSTKAKKRIVDAYRYYAPWYRKVSLYVKKIFSDSSQR